MAVNLLTCNCSSQPSNLENGDGDGDGDVLFLKATISIAVHSC